MRLGINIFYYMFNWFERAEMKSTCLFSTRCVKYNVGEKNVGQMANEQK